MVFRPGKYFIDDDTTLSDLINRAGVIKRAYIHMELVF